MNLSWLMDLALNKSHHNLHHFECRWREAMLHLWLTQLPLNLYRNRAYTSDIAPCENLRIKRYQTYQNSRIKCEMMWVSLSSSAMLMGCCKFCSANQPFSLISLQALGKGCTLMDQCPQLCGTELLRFLRYPWRKQHHDTPNLWI